MNIQDLEDMGCGTSSATKDKKSEKALKAALVIQNWYRGYRARLKTRQRYALTIFQSIEYADEQGQLQLSNFFSFMLENYTRVQEKEPGLVTRLFGSSIQDKDRQDYLGLIEVPDSYCGPRLQFPLTFTDIDLLIEAFKQQQILHAYYVLEVLFETKKVLQQMPNFTHTSTSPSKEITICGDLHGKLDDLFLIFYKVVDILWSDPRGKRGCYPNTNRGGGCYFGPDITAKILNKYQLKMLVRSHECKPEGYEICHDGKVITVFSASNYYEEGSNRGAYIRMSSGTTPRFFQYQITRATCFRPLYQRVNAIESSAIRMLKERMISRKTDLTRAFQLQDRNKSGKLSMGQWAFSMENVLGLNLPWRSLSSHLVTTDKDGNIDYMSGFQDVHIQKPVKEVQSTLIETVYRYRSDLQIIFNIIDSDHSGLISMEEFRSMWKLFKSHYSVHIDDSQFDELAERMDLNKDGSIDFNEFLKAFYVVHKFAGLPLAFTVAHELGHSFGIQHDGKENDCEPVGRHLYIMSRQLQYNPAPLMWSKCSKDYITRFLDRGWGFCLDDIPQKKGLKSNIIAPGVIYDVHHQCQLQYGPNATFCQEVENVCQTLWCSVKGFCRSKLDAAADGTQCGEKKWCMAGKCITVGKKPESIPGGWGRWSPWSHCSRTCGAGAQSAERLCNNPEPKFGGKYCTGERKRYRLCNIHPCRPDTPTFRQMQCSEFDTVPYRNEFYHWFPVFNPARPCELYCRPIDGHFSEKMLDAVIDGTPCFEGGNSRNVCINGMCKMVGCDYEIDSNATEDRCGVCLGDGSACQTVKKMFKQKEGSGYVDIGLIPKGARDIRVMEVEGAGNFLAIRSEDPEKYYLNGGFIIQWNGNYKLAGTIFQYDRKGDLEKLMATGPTNESVWIQLLFQVTNPGIKYEYTIRKDGLDNDVEKLVYFWQYGRWTECSVTCGTGIRRQTAHCVKKGRGIVKATFCDPETQPNGRQKKCHEKDCPPRWWAGEWEACSATCGPHGEKTRTVLCIQTMGSDEQALPAQDCQHLLKPKTLVSCNRDILCPSDWTVGNWSECSVSCGGGVRIRSVTCAKNHDEPCDMTRKPNSRALCGLQQCPSSRRILKPNRGTIFSGKKLPTHDPFKPVPPTTPSPRVLTTPSPGVLTTPTVPGPLSPSAPTVNSPDPSTASKGDLDGKQGWNSSIQTELDTHNVISTGSTSQPILTSRSLSIQPNEENVSNPDTGPTSKGDLIITTTSGSDLSTSSNAVTWQVTSFYSPLTKEPEMEIHSGSGEDREPSEKKDENNSVTWTKIRVPGNDAPGERSIEIPLGAPPTPYLVGTSLWPPFSTVSEGLVPSQRPITVKNGASRAEGMVTEKPANTPLPLGADHQPAYSKEPVNHRPPELPSNMNLTQSPGPVLTKEDATSLMAEGFLLNASDYKHLSMGHSPAYWIVGNWSECSTTCGLGTYRRSVQCSTHVDSDCATLRRPDPAKRCHLRPCASWKVGNWSKCSRNCSGGFQIREIQCVDSRDRRSLRPFHCRFLAGLPPPLTSSCNVEPCEEWQVEPWSECSSSCGGGVQKRGVTCPGGLCDWTKRPTSSAPCSGPPCCHWAAGNWDPCTVSCGGGFQKRTVHCMASENNKTEGQDRCLCDHEPRPPEFQRCNPQACRKNADLLCTKDNLSASFCQTLKTMKKCSVPTVRAQCCLSCSQTHVAHTQRPRKRQPLKIPKAP